MCLPGMTSPTKIGKNAAWRSPRAMLADRNIGFIIDRRNHGYSITLSSSTSMTMGLPRNNRPNGRAHGHGCLQTGNELSRLGISRSHARSPKQLVILMAAANASNTLPTIQATRPRRGHAPAFNYLPPDGLDPKNTGGLNREICHVDLMPTLPGRQNAIKQQPYLGREIILPILTGE